MTASATDAPASGQRIYPVRPNMEGAWEKDFGRSDRWDTELQRTIDRLNRDAQRPDGGGYSTNGRRGAGNIVAYAQLAELITRQTTMEVMQTEAEVRIERQGDAALICSTENNALDTFSSIHGTEYCGWDRLQLVFQIILSEGVFIEHRFSVSEDGQELSMLTSISNGSSVPFNLVQFFNRYDAPSDDYNCVQTLSRGRVCSTADSPEDGSANSTVNPPQ